MTRSSRNHDDFFSRTATVLTELNGVRQVANDISLAASNAKAVAARVGNRAAGFVPITDSIDAMGRETAELVDRVNLDARRTVRDMVAAERFVDCVTRMERGMADIEAPSPYLSDVAHELQKQHSVARETTLENLSQLIELLSTISDHARAATMVASCSRVEATVAGNYQASLESVADTVEQAAQHVRDVVTKCAALLRGIQ